MTSLRLSSLIAVLAFALIAAPAHAEPSVDVAVKPSAAALTVHLSGRDPEHRRVFVAALATTAAKCPAQPTAAARLVTARPKRAGAWTKRLRLTPGRPGLAAKAGDDLQRVADDGVVCSWQLRSRSLDGKVLATATAASDGGPNVAVLAAVAAAAATIGLSMWGRRRRRRPAAAPDHSGAISEAPPLPPPGPRRPEIAFGTDGSTEWHGAPPAPEQMAVMDFRDVRLGDPRLN